MKKLVILISLLFVKLIAFSQIDTSKTEKCFTLPVAKQIMKDIISGDSAKAQLKITEEELSETQKKVSLKDSIIITLRSKETNYLTIIDGEKQKFDIMEKHSKKLEWDLKKEKVKNKFKSIISVGIIGVLTFFIINK